MRFTRSSCVLVLAIASASVGCSGSSPPASPTTTAAVVVLSGLTATVEPITTPGNGWLYRLTYQVREIAGMRGATLANQQFSLSNGLTAGGTFNTMTECLQPRRSPFSQRFRSYRRRRRRPRHTWRSRSPSQTTAGSRVQPAPKRTSLRRTDAYFTKRRREMVVLKSFDSAYQRMT